MAYYNYYQNNVPHWGQTQYAQQLLAQGYQFATPPIPTYQPQPGWTGQDYYQAHYRLANGGVTDTDYGLFDYVWSRLKSLVGGTSVGPSEAKHWHRRVYGGMVETVSLTPTELGAAAGYEAYRLFTYHRSIYRQPLADDRDREEEALAGLAIAEATKLWSYGQRPGDSYGRRETCEVAAATAERLLRKDRRRGGYRSRRRGSFSYSPSVYGDDYDDDYDRYSSDDDNYHYGRGSRRRSSGSLSMIPSYGNSYGTGQYPAQITYAGQQVGYPSSAPAIGYTSAAHGMPYGYATAQPQVLSTSPTAGLVVPQVRPRATSFGYAGGYPTY